ncbi:MAG: site-specific integrase [Planctomycetes bacterium]|nr:site-specific integrase [Planctomycetota bacterium]
MKDLRETVIGHYRRNQLRSLKRAKEALKKLARFFGAKCDLASIDYLALTRFIDWDMKEHAPATALYSLSILRKGLKELERAGLLHCPVFPKIRIRNARKVFFEEEELRAMQPHLPAYLRSLVLFLALTGWRRGEATALRWSDIDFTQGIIRINDSKNGEGRIFPFRDFPKLRALLEEQRQRTTELEKKLKKAIPWVFWSQPEIRPYQWGERLRDFRKSWIEALRLAGLRDKKPHDLRRTAVRNLTRAGIPRAIAMKLIGHKTESIYTRYDIVSEPDLQNATAQLGRYLERKTAPVANNSPGPCIVEHRATGGDESAWFPGGYCQ